MQSPWQPRRRSTALLALFALLAGLLLSPLAAGARGADPSAEGRIELASSGGGWSGTALPESRSVDPTRHGGAPQEPLVGTFAAVSDTSGISFQRGIEAGGRAESQRRSWTLVSERVRLQI